METDPKQSTQTMEGLRNQVFAKAAIGLIALTGATSEALAFGAQPVSAEGQISAAHHRRIGLADNVPVHQTRVYLADTALNPALEQECASDIFKQPQILPFTGMYHAGKKRQSFDVGLGFGAVDPACDGHFERLPYFKPQLVRHGHTINESPRWIPLFTPGYNPNVAGNFGLTYYRSLTDPKYKYWRPGDKVQFELSLREFSLETKKVVASSITTHRIRVVTRKP